MYRQSFSTNSKCVFRIYRQGYNSNNNNINAQKIPKTYKIPRENKNINYMALNI